MHGPEGSSRLVEPVPSADGNQQNSLAIMPGAMLCVIVSDCQMKDSHSSETVRDFDPARSREMNCSVFQTQLQW